MKWAKNVFCEFFNLPSFLTDRIPKYMSFGTLVEFIKVAYEMLVLRKLTN